MSDVIIIPVDLDQKALEKSFDEVEKTAEKRGQETGEKTGESLNDGLNSALSKNNLSEKLNKELDKISLDRFKDKVRDGFATAFQVIDAGVVVGAVGAALSPILRDFKNFGKAIQDVGKGFLSGKNLLGIATVASALSLALDKLSLNLSESESAIVSFTGNLLKLGSIIAGGTAVAIGFLIVGLSNFAISFSRNVLEVLDRSSQQFLKLNAEFRVLSATLDAFNRSSAKSVGNIEEYEVLIGGLSKRLNILQADLTKSAREIVQVGSQAGLTRNQLRQLLVISAEYAKINEKDVFGTAVALTGALQGNAQAVTALGIKLNQSAVESFALKEGLQENFNQLTDNQKVQIRYNKLLDQFNKVQGIADTRAQSLADSQNALQVNIERINKSFGIGTSIILRNNALYKTANIVANQLSDTFLTASGFVASFFSLLTLGIGTLTKFAFNIFLVTKAIKALQLAFQTAFVQNIFARNIGLINTSLNGLLTQSAGAGVQVKSLSDLLNALRFSILNFTKGGGLGLSGFFIGLKNNIVALIGTLKTLSVVIAPLLIILLKIGVIVGAIATAFLLLRKAIVIIQENTQVFTDVWLILLEAFRETSPLLKSIVNLFVEFGKLVRDIAVKAFGFFIQKLVQGFSLIASLVRRNPFGVFSDETVEKFAQIERKLDGFSDKIEKVAFDFTKLKTRTDETRRSLASLNTVEFNLQKFRDLQKEFEGFGQTDSQLARQQLNERLALLNAGLQQAPQLTSQILALRAQVIQDFKNKEEQALSESAINFSNFGSQVTAGLRQIAKQSQVTGKTVASALINGIGRGAGNAFSAFGQAIVSGENALEAFGKALLSAFGQSLVQLGTGFILQGVAQSLAGFGSGAPLIAAGAALATFGGVLSGIAGGGAPQTQGGATGAIGSDGGFGTSPELPPLSDQEANEPETRVQVVIQGDVFDSEETGLRIAQVLQEASLNNNVKILGGIA